MRRIIVSMAAALWVSAFVGNAAAQIKPGLPAPTDPAPAGSPVAIHGALKAGKVGSQGAIVDKNGDPVVLRGMSMFWANSLEGKPYYCDDVVSWLAYDFKVSVIRAAIGADKDGGGGLVGYADGDSAGTMSSAIEVIEACIKRGVYVIADWHVHNTSFSNKAQSFFTVIASKYGKYPNVLFEPFNEPLQDASWGGIAGFVNPLITEIRKHSDNLVLVGSPSWSQKPNDASGINGTNVAYTFHFYTNSHPYSSLGSNVSGAVNKGLAVLVTEFGTVNANGDGSHNAGGTDTWLTALEGLKVGWVNWSVTHKNEGASILSTNGVAGGPGGAWASMKTNGTYIKGKITAGNSSYYSTNTFTITTTASEGGKVEKKVGGTVNNGPYSYGAKVTVSAVPDDGYEWDHWEGEVGNSSTKATLSEYTVKGVNVKNVKAVFVPTSGLVKNGYFTHSLQFDGSNVWMQNGVTLAHDDAALKATVTAADAHVRQQNMNLEKGKKYRLTFRAKASQGSGSVTPRVTNQSRTNNYLPNPTAEALTTQWKEITREFDMCTDDSKATLVLECTNGMTWYLDDVRLIEAGAVAAGTCGTAALLPAAAQAHRIAWSVSRNGGSLQLRGPADAGAKAMLYDTRGRMVRSMAATDGLTLGAGIPAGNYIMVVKNSIGKEMLRTRVSTVK